MTTTRRPATPVWTDATKAARAVNGALAIPDFGDSRSDEAADFNDLTRLRGLEAVKKCVENAKLVNDLLDDLVERTKKIRSTLQAGSDRAAY
jgi:phage/plasmid primase-like uncharacterized protein